MIKSYDIVRYILNGKYVVVQTSNIVYVKLINPIIVFKKVICGSHVKVIIFNNSGKTIRNIIYKECINLLTDVIINNKLFKDINIKKGINLGSIKNNNTVVLEYCAYTNCDKSLLIYNIIIDNKVDKIYLVSKTMC